MAKLKLNDEIVLIELSLKSIGIEQALPEFPRLFIEKGLVIQSISMDKAYVASEAGSLTSFESKMFGRVFHYTHFEGQKKGSLRLFISKTDYENEETRQVAIDKIRAGLHEHLEELIKELNEKANELRSYQDRYATSINIKESA